MSSIFGIYNICTRLLGVAFYYYYYKAAIISNVNMLLNGSQAPTGRALRCGRGMGLPSPLAVTAHRRHCLHVPRCCLHAACTCHDAACMCHVPFPEHMMVLMECGWRVCDLV